MREATELFDVREAMVIHRGDTLVVRVNSGLLTTERAAKIREALIGRIGPLVNDVIVIGADGLAVIRGGECPVVSQRSLFFLAGCGIGSILWLIVRVAVQ